MRKIQLVCLLLLFGLTINTTIAQNSYDNFENELNVDIVYKQLPNNSECSGEIEILTNGVAPFKFSIDGGETFANSPNYNGLCAQRYFVHVRDAEGKLGLALVKFFITKDIEVASIDTTQLLTDFQNSTNVNEKRELQLQLAVLGIKFPVTITQNAEGSFLVPMYRLHKNNDAFANRMINAYPKIKSITVENDVMQIFFHDFKESYLSKLSEKMGYSGYELINE